MPSVAENVTGSNVVSYVSFMDIILFGWTLHAEVKTAKQSNFEATGEEGITWQPEWESGADVQVVDMLPLYITGTAHYQFA